MQLRSNLATLCGNQHIAITALLDLCAAETVICCLFSSSQKLSTAQKKLSRVDTSGMKSIASFFGKPKKAWLMSCNIPHNKTHSGGIMDRLCAMTDCWMPLWAVSWNMVLWRACCQYQQQTWQSWLWSSVQTGPKARCVFVVVPKMVWRGLLFLSLKYWKSFSFSMSGKFSEVLLVVALTLWIHHAPKSDLFEQFNANHCNSVLRNWKSGNISCNQESETEKLRSFIAEDDFQYHLRSCYIPIVAQTRDSLHEDLWRLQPEALTVAWLLMDECFHWMQKPANSIAKICIDFHH